jgi:hypothetical protein
MVGGTVLAVPIASSTARQTERQGVIGQSGPQIRVVAGVPGFHRVEAFILEALEEGTGTPLLQVCG